MHAVARRATRSSLRARTRAGPSLSVAAAAGPRASGARGDSGEPAPAHDVDEERERERHHQRGEHEEDQLEPVWEAQDLHHRAARVTTRLPIAEWLSFAVIATAASVRWKVGNHSGSP